MTLVIPWRQFKNFGHLDNAIVRAEDGTTGVPMWQRVLPTPNDWGALGDGTTVDTDAFARMWAAVDDGDVIRLLPGCTYIIDEPQTVNDKSLTVLAHGATVKMADDSYNYWLTLVPTDTATQLDYFHWYGGVIDGNKANQYYWPAPYDDYADSNINGAAFDESVMSAKRTGNAGLIAVKNVKDAMFSDIWVKDPVENGLYALWGDTIRFKNIKGTGGLPIHLLEMNAQGWNGVEAAFCKVQSFNEALLPQGEKQSGSVAMEGCDFDGGCMGLFVRTNNLNGAKPEQPQSRVTVTGTNIRAMSRTAIWCEIAAELYVHGGHYSGEYKPTHAYRGNGGRILAGNGAKTAHIAGAKVVNGSIDFSNGNEIEAAVVTGCHVRYTRDADGSYAIDNASKVSDCTVMSSDQGIRTRDGGSVIGSTIENESGNAVLADNIIGCNIGRKLHTITTYTATATDGQTVFDTNNANLYRVDRVYRTIDGIESDTPLLVPETEYSVSGDTVTMDTEANAGDVIAIEYVASVTETFTASAGQTQFTTTATGYEFVSVTVNGTPYTAVQSAAGAGQYVPFKPSGGNTLRATTAAMAGGETVALKFLPLLQRTAGPVKPSSARMRLADSFILGSGGVIITTNAATGPHLIADCVFMDQDGAAITLGGGVIDVKISDCHFERTWENCVRCEVATVRAQIMGCTFRNFGLNSNPASNQARRAIGADTGAGWTSLELMADGNYFINEVYPGAFTEAGTVSASTTFASRQNNYTKNLSGGLGTWSATTVVDFNNTVVA